MKVTIGFIVIMKMGAMVPVQERLFGVVDWRTVVGLGSFGAAGLIYSWILAFLPLNVAQSFMAAQLLAVILASALFLSEPIPDGRWLGIALIFVGILIVSATGGFSMESEALR